MHLVLEFKGFHANGIFIQWVKVRNTANALFFSPKCGFLAAYP